MQNTQGLPLEVRLSAYIDGEVNEAEKKELEALISGDDDARALHEMLSAGNTFGNKAFEEMLHEPVPLALVRRIKQGAELTPKTERVTEGPVRLAQATFWPKALAASIALLIVGGSAGYMIGQSNVAGPAATQMASRGWLDDIAEYHRIYARPGERLVEVPASQGTDGIQTWLASSVGVDFQLPDLSSQGLKFEGARLLVAVGKPVAQLTYRDESGAVFAICFLKTKPVDKPTPVVDTNRGDIDLLSWNKGDAAYVVVGPANNANLKTIAASVATSI